LKGLNAEGNSEMELSGIAFTTVLVSVNQSVMVVEGEIGCPLQYIHIAWPL
jgi:hypothetical protein